MECYPSHRRVSALVLLSLALVTGPLANRAECSVSGWGYNWFPGGPNAFNPVSRPSSAASNAVMVAAGAGHALALRPDGTVVGWGDQSFLQAHPPGGLTNVTQIAAGSWHSLALKQDGTVVAWGAGKTVGSGLEFQMGQSQVPAGLSNVVQVAAGFTHSLALRADGTVVAWGANEIGQCNVPPGLSNVVGIACGDSHSLAVKADGTVVAWGHYFSRSAFVPEGLSNVVAVEGGGQSLALKADGTVVAWGEANDRGQLDVPAGLTGVVEIAAGGIHNMVLTAEGRPIAWGAGETFHPSTYEDYGQSIVPPALTNVSAIACGTYQSVAVAGDAPPRVHMSAVDRTVLYGATTWLRIQASGTRPLSYQWKFNGTDLPDATNAVLEVSGTDFSREGMYSVEVSNRFGSATGRPTKLSVAPMFASVTPSQVSLLGWPAEFRVEVLGQGPFTYQWRLNGADLPGATGETLRVPRVRLDRVGNYSVVVSSPFGTAESFPAFLGVTKVAAWGSGIWGETNVPSGLLDVSSISAGGGFNLALRYDGSVVAWGNNELTQCNVPTNLNQVVAVSAGGSHSLALKADGTVASWGALYPPFAPPPPGLSNVFAIASPGVHDLALLKDGGVVGWGLNTSNQISIPPNLGSVVAISGGYEFSLALRADGTVAHWGNFQTSLDGSPSDPAQDSPLTNVVAISGGAKHYLALLADGSVATRGVGVLGPAQLPPGLGDIVAVVAGGYHNLALRRDGTMVGWSVDSTNVEEVAGPLPERPVPLAQRPLLTPKEVDCVAAISVGYESGLALIAEGPPRLESPMIDRAVNKGSTAYFRISATGAGPLQYQWRFSGIDIEGATNSVLSVPNARVQDQGQYAVTVSNSRGSITSPEATLSIQPFSIIVSPKPRNTYRGDTVVLDVRVSGEGPFEYQWQFNGLNLDAATDSTLVLSGARVEQSGLYSVEISSPIGRKTTMPVEVSIGQVIEWGYTPNGVITLPAGLTNIIAIAGGETHSLALTSDGHVIAWGSAPSAATLVPTNLDHVIAIDGGALHSMALRSDGTVACWGDNSSGQGPGPIRAHQCGGDRRRGAPQPLPAGQWNAFRMGFQREWTEHPPQRAVERRGGRRRASPQPGVEG